MFDMVEYEMLEDRINTQWNKVEENYERYARHMAVSVTGQESQAKGSKRQVRLHLARMRNTIDLMHGIGLNDRDTRGYERFIGRTLLKVDGLHNKARGERLGLPVVEFYDDQYEIVHYVIVWEGRLQFN